MSKRGPKTGSKSRVGSRNTSGEKYVHYEKSRRMWRVIVNFDGTRKAIGRFKTIMSAVNHRDEFIERLAFPVEGKGNDKPKLGS